MVSDNWIEPKGSKEDFFCNFNFFASDMEIIVTWLKKIDSILRKKSYTNPDKIFCLIYPVRISKTNFFQGKTNLRIEHPLKYLIKHISTQ